MKLPYLMIILSIIATFAAAEPYCTICNGTCQTGYYFDSWRMLCVQCSGGCATCTDADTCTSCNTGYYIQSLGSCVPCGLENCIACSSTGLCTACDSGYYLSGGTCISCSLT